MLHQLTKVPFEPLRKASHKHLTFKTVFLLALGSGKRRSEIHAWLYKNIRHQENWTRVSLYPSPSFISSWLRKVQPLWLLWLSQPWLPLWSGLLGRISPFVLSEPYVTIWIEPRICELVRSWFSYPSAWAFGSISCWLRFLLGLSRQYSCVINCQMKRLKAYIR